MMKRIIIIQTILLLILSCKSRKDKEYERFYDDFVKYRNEKMYLTKSEFLKLYKFQDYAYKYTQNKISVEVYVLFRIDTKRKLIHEKKLEYDVWNYEKYKNSSYLYIQHEFEKKLGVKIHEGFQFDWDEDYSDYSTITQYYLSNSDECFIYEIQIGLPTSKIDNKESILFHEFEYLVLKYDLQYFKQDLKKTVEYFKKDTTYSEIESEKLLEAIEKYSNCRK